MGTSTQILPTDYVVQMIPEMLKAFDQAQAEDYKIIWNIGMAFLWQHFLAIAAILIVAWIFSLLLAFAGRWGLFGSLTYNYLYFGTLWVIGLIFGPAVFANDWFKIVLAILYVVCFSIVGWLLHTWRLRRRRW